MYTVINEYKEGYTEWLEFDDIKNAISTAIKLKLSGNVAKVYKGTGDNVFDRVFPIRS